MTLSESGACVTRAVRQNLSHYHLLGMEWLFSRQARHVGLIGFHSIIEVNLFRVEYEAIVLRVHGQCVPRYGERLVALT